MLEAFLITLGVLLAILFFFVILIVGFIELIKAIVKVFKKSKS